VISSELPEVISLSDRIVVLRSGRMAGELPRRDATEDSVLRLMAGIGDPASGRLATGA
jgi:ABC-type sugar transport system ATPase subunit